MHDQDAAHSLTYTQQGVTGVLADNSRGPAGWNAWSQGMIRQTCSLELALKLRNHLLCCIPLHLDVVAQLVRPLFTLSLHRNNDSNILVVLELLVTLLLLFKDQ